MDTTAVNETVVSSEQSDSFARADSEVDRMPFNFRGEFKQFYKKGIYSDIAKDVIRPSAEECARNSRAKSTKMRWAIRS